MSHDGNDEGGKTARPGISRNSKSPKEQLLRLAVSLVIGFGVLAFGAWLLSKWLATPDSSYQGKPAMYWMTQLNTPGAPASNAAVSVLNNEIIPHLAGVMLHDTNDSAFKLRVIDALNGLPGLSVDFEPADLRRKSAAYELGEYGPPARQAVPALLQALMSADDAVRETAATSLGAIGADPEKVIPVLTRYLSDDDVNVRAATALGDFGPLAKAAVPELVRMWQRGNGEARYAASGALKQIDAGAFAQLIHAKREANSGARTAAGQ